MSSAAAGKIVYSFRHGNGFVFLSALEANELAVPGESPPGLAILRLAMSPRTVTAELVSRLLRDAREDTDCERAAVIVNLLEEVLIRRYHELDREEIRRMFKLHDIRKTRVWQEAVEEGREEGRAFERRQLVKRLRANGQSMKAIAELMGISVTAVRRLIGREGR